MKYSAWLLVLGVGLALGCGGGGETPPTGFEDPDTFMKAYNEVDGVWTEVGTADWSCLNTASADVATSVEITLTGEVNDFQTGNDVPGEDVDAFQNVDWESPFDQTVTDDDAGMYTVTVPVGTKRFGFKMTGEGTMDTFLLNQYIEPDVAEQTLDIDSVSELTANALPAFIGVTRTVGLGIVAGAMRDCNDHEVYGAIATVSSVQGEPEHLEGSDQTGTYYFSAGSTSLPVRNGQQAYTNFDGLFMVIELPPATTPQWLQVWGFLDQEGLDSGDLTLIAEIPTPVLADTAVTFSIEPLRN